MDIRIKESGGATIVEIIGSIDAASASTAQAQVVEAVQSKSKIVLDMSQVSFMSSAGLRILLITYRSVTGRGGQVIVAGLQETLKDTLANVGFLDFLPHQDTVDGALAVLNA